MAVTTEQVAELYVSFFDRAPDADGLAYWVDSGLAIEEISSSFFDQEETQTKYPETMSDAEFVNTIYVNMFNHNGDPDGLTYWENELATGSITRANMILAIGNGAQGTDQTILDNKTEVGLYFADAGLNDVEEATDVMNDVDETEASVSAAKVITDGYASLDLTVEKDTIVGTDSDDTISGFTDLSTGTKTYSAGDSIDGGEGNDTFKLNIKSGTAVDAVGTLNNVETVELSGTPITAGISAANWNGVEKYSLGSSGNYLINDIGTKVSSISGDKLTAATDAITLNFASNEIITGDEDALDVTISNSSLDLTITTQAATIARDVYESLTIHSNDNSAGGTSGVTLANSADLTAVTIDGNSDTLLAFSVGGGSRVESVDASALTGGLYHTSLSTIGATIKGGSGKDNITGSGSISDTIYGGAGEDKIAAGAGGATIYGGAGKDALTGAGGIDAFKFEITDSGLTTATADTIGTFTSGKDTLSFRGVEAGTDGNLINDSTTGISTIELAVAEANKGILDAKTYVFYTAGKILVVDADGDGEADTALAITSTVTTLDSADITLF